MKKTLILTIITAFLIIILAQNTSATPQFNDSFEDGDSTDWITPAPPVDMLINSSSPIRGLYSGWLIPDGSGDYVYKNYSTNYSRNITINLRIRHYVGRIYAIIAGARNVTANEAEYYYNSLFLYCVAPGGEYQFSNGVVYTNLNAKCNTTTHNITILMYDFGEVQAKAHWRFNGVSTYNASVVRGRVKSVDKMGFAGLQAQNSRYMIDDIQTCLGNWNTSCLVDQAPGVDYFRITLRDEDDPDANTTIDDFIAVVNGTTYGTNNGSIGTNILNNASVNVSINITSNFSGGYFSRDLNYSVTTDLNTTLYQTITNLTALEVITNNSLTGTFFRNNTEINITNQHFSAGNYTFKFSNTSYFNQSLNFTLPALFNGTFNISGVYNTELYIYIRNAYTNQSLSNFSGWVYNPANLYNVTHNATPSNVSITGLAQGLDYTIYAEHPHYSISADNYENITINDTSYNLTLYLYSNNSIMIYIRDEDTNILITDNITITLTYNTSENQTTTTNGTHFYEGLRDGNYTLKFSGSNYTTKSYAVTLADRSTQILTAYLSQNYESVIFTIRDSLTNAVIEDASFTMARLINSTWTTTESKTSDITGRVQVSYLPGIRYRFTISASNYTSKVFYLDPVIFDSYNVNLDPVISIELTQDYGEVNVVFYPRVFYDNQTNNFIWFITSPKGALTNYSINITFPGGQQNRSGVNAIGEQFDISFNISGATLYDRVNITYTYDTTLSELKTFRYDYGILGLATGNNTIEQLRQTDYGFGIFEQLLISIIAVLILAGFTFMLAGAGAGLFVGMLVYGFFVYIGFLPLWSILITLLVGFVLVVKLSSDVG